MKRLGWILVCVSLIWGLLPTQARAADLEAEAKSALLMDVATGTILFEQNSHEPLAPASVTKVMTMLLIMEAIDSGKIGWSDAVTTSEAAAAYAKRAEKADPPERTSSQRRRRRRHSKLPSQEMKE